MFDSMGLAAFLKAVLYVNAALAVALASDFFGLVPSMPFLSQVPEDHHRLRAHRDLVLLDFPPVPVRILVDERSVDPDCHRYRP